jgi:hypothetical protein
MAALILICRLLTPPAVLSTDSRAQSQSNMRGEPVSRILSRSTPLPAQSWAIIHLGGLLPGPSSCQPEPAGLKRPICGSYLALLPVGLAVPRLLPAARWALPHRFTITLHARLSLLCGAIPRVTPAGRYPAPLFHGVRTFLEGCPPRLPMQSFQGPSRAHRTNQKMTCFPSCITLSPINSIPRSSKLLRIKENYSRSSRQRLLLRLCYHYTNVLVQEY